MAVCLDYQSVTIRREEEFVVSWRKYLVLGIILLSVLALRVRNRHLEVAYGYQIHKEHELTESLNVEKEDLEYQVSVLTRFENLRDEADKRLKLQPVAESVFRVNEK
jgi:hypothetical protein